ncbi:hypothetical protein N0V90_013202 [Kalmusia sp. IMI 367209]|nr:hypothetical protein N0V90_013202 [Kalmusia sp. IMI 367209]
MVGDAHWKTSTLFLFTTQTSFQTTSIKSITLPNIKMNAVTFCFLVAAFLNISNAEPDVQQPRALVYRGPATCDGCPEAVAQLLQSSSLNFSVAYAGPNEEVDVNKQSLEGAQVFAFGGGPDLEDAYKEVENFKKPLQDFVAAGGHYLGFCLGAYLAGSTPGFELLPDGINVGSEVGRPGSQVGNENDTVIQVDWTFNNGQTEKNKWLYFQDGAYVTEFESEQGKVVARYSTSRDIAASVTQYGDGWVGLVGPHPEADESWYSDANITNPDGIDFKFGYDFLLAAIPGAVDPE